MSAGCHHHHRQRMRDRYLQAESFDSFADHEILEMMLGTVISRKNTNECAHLLIERFGNWKNVLNASVEELMQVDGIGEVAAVEIKVIHEVMRRYMKDTLITYKKYDLVSEIVKFLYPKFLGQTRECIYMLMLDNRLRMIDFRLVQVGTVNRSEVPIGSMVKLALEKNVPNVVIAHNHPDGMAKPSLADCDVTDELIGAFSLVGVNLIEHLVFTETQFVPILRRLRMDPRCADHYAQFECKIGEDFYDLDAETFVFSDLLKNERILP